MLRGFLNVAFVAFCVHVAATRLPAQQADYYYDRAGDAFDKGNYEQAIADYTQALRFTDPSVTSNIALIYSERGLAFFRKRDFERAMADQNQSLRLNPNDGVAYINRGIIWYEKEEYDKAIADYDAALRLLEPDDKSAIAQAYKERGVARREKGDNDGSLADLNEAVRFNPQKDFFYLERGITWEKMQEYDNALSDYNQAVALDPGDYYYRTRAWVQSLTGRYAEAIADYQKAIELDPKYAAAFNGLAWLYATCPDEKYRNAEKAFQYASKAYQIDGLEYWGRLDTLAAAYAENEAFQQAVEWEEKALAMAEKDKSTTAEELADARARLELYKQKKPYREVLKKK